MLRGGKSGIILNTCPEINFNFNSNSNFLLNILINAAGKQQEYAKFAASCWRMTRFSCIPFPFPAFPLDTCLSTHTRQIGIGIRPAAPDSPFPIFHFPFAACRLPFGFLRLPKSESKCCQIIFTRPHGKYVCAAAPMTNRGYISPNTSVVQIICREQEFIQPARELS